MEIISIWFFGVVIFSLAVALFFSYLLVKKLKPLLYGLSPAMSITIAAMLVFLTVLTFPALFTYSLG
jgi:hypothetical protein